MIVGVRSLFLVLGVVGVFGPRTAEKSATGEGWEVSVTYPRVTRPGLGVRVTVDEVLSGARNQGIAELAEVQIGVLEADGKFSFLTRDKEQHQPDGKHST